MASIGSVNFDGLVSGLDTKKLIEKILLVLIQDLLRGLKNGSLTLKKNPISSIQ